MQCFWRGGAMPQKKTGFGILERTVVSMPLLVSTCEGDPEPTLTPNFVDCGVPSPG